MTEEQDRDDNARVVAQWSEAAAISCDADANRLERYPPCHTPSTRQLLNRKISRARNDAVMHRQAAALIRQILNKEPKNETW